MFISRSGWDEKLRRAICAFWNARSHQGRQQGRRSGKSDRGTRKEVTGGRQFDGFAELIEELAEEVGLSREFVFRGKRIDLPGYYRPEKKWDVVIAPPGKLLAAIEFKAHVGPSFGNNFNNRSEEALGSATDYWTAYREGAFGSGARPWLGYLMLLEDAPAVRRPVGNMESHFPVFPEFRTASYARRYEILLTKMMRERLFDAASLILSPRPSAGNIRYSEPCAELSFRSFVEGLSARLMAFAAATR